MKEAETKKDSDATEDHRDYKDQHARWIFFFNLKSQIEF